MLYGLVGSLLLGALSSALLAWRLASAQRDLAETRASLTNARQSDARAQDALLQERADRADERDRLEAEISILKGQRDHALEKLAPGSIADLLRARNTH